MATDNGNGNGRNGNGGRNVNTSQVISIATVISMGVLFLGMFGFWWNTADPRTRLTEIEHNQTDNRRELNDIIANLRKEIASNYLNLREHTDLQNRIQIELNELRKEDELFLTKAQFDAWKSERDKYIERIVHRIDELNGDIKAMKENLVTRNESAGRWAGFDKADADNQRRFEDLLKRVETMRDNSPVTAQVNLINDRINQLYAQLRELQQQIFETTHNRGQVSK